MRSLHVRILLTCFATLLVALMAFVPLSMRVSGRTTRRAFERVYALQLEQAVDAYKRAGVPALSAFLEKLNAFGSEHYLTDAAGRDLLTRRDHSALLRGAPDILGILMSDGSPKIDGRLVMTLLDPSGRYRFIVVADPPFPASSFAPYYLLMLAAVVCCSWLIAVGIVTPLRMLSNAVDRFGRGELKARVSYDGRNEIGDLARSFNNMADRTETLLTAERRLLLDISHELRSPLARLNFAIELSRTASDRDAAVDRLQKETDRLTDLIGGLIEVTRVEGDPSIRRSEEVRLAEIVREVVDWCAVEAEVRRCRVMVHGASLRTIRGDAELFRRAIENVLRNAIRYAPQGTAVDVSVDEKPSALVVSVRDWGPGVPAELLSRIFEPFFRVDNARRPDTGGMGLGLAIASRAVQLHQGTLTAEDAGPGLRVTMTIPLGPAQVISPRSSQHTGSESLDARGRSLAVRP
jgi:two-component system sensor histidine kinase CpxA